jgi:MFS family permease
MSLAQSVLQVTWALYTEHRYNWGPKAIGISFLVLGVLTGTVQSTVVKRLVPKMGEARSVLLGLSISVAALLGYGLASHGWMLYAVMSVGVFAGIAGPALQAYITKHVPANEQGAVQGVYSGLQSLASIPGPLLGGWSFGWAVEAGKPGWLAGTPFFLVTSAGVPARTIPELVAYAKAHPARLTYISYGDGSVSRVAFEWLKTAAGIDLLEIPYKGSAPATADLLAGRVDMGLYDFSAVEQHVRTGTLHMLAAIGAERAASAPDVATVAEQGVPGYAIEAWYGLLAPAGTPPDVVAAISGAIDEIRRTAAFGRRLAESLFEGGRKGGKYRTSRPGPGPDPQGARSGSRGRFAGPATRGGSRTP